VTYTKAALTGLFVAGGEGSAARDEMGDKKQAAATAAARFLYMVVLYMAPVEQNKYPPARRYLLTILKQVYKVSFSHCKEVPSHAFKPPISLVSNFHHFSQLLASFCWMVARCGVSFESSCSS
jgi:hypothetical protein